MELGPFRVEGLIATGGMGRVLAGVHVPSALPVAIKILPGAQDAAAAVRREVRATAGLQHPHIVPILDQGDVAEGPYLVMTRAAGTLHHRPPGRWARLRQVLGEVLSGLGHAHARGVLHRDVKASNVLLDEGGGTLLADFGVATALGLEDRTVAGTPGAMAPEQLRGSWRDYGPWTDLYGVGCLAYALLTGRAPTVGTDPLEALGERLARGRVSTPPLFAVPEGLWSWLVRMLRRDPADRYRRAADALFALEALGSVPAELEHAAAPGVGSVGFETSWSFFDQGAPSAPDMPRPALSSLPPVELPPVPPTWRRPEVRPAARLVGAGLRLFGLRATPEVGRIHERDVLWAALEGLGSGPRSAVLAGEAGTGKTHLARWLAERAHEVGAATTLTVVNNRAAGPANGPVAALQRALRLEGLSSFERRGRLAVLLPDLAPVERERFLKLLDAQQSRRISAAQQASAVAAVVAALARSRPVVLHLDDLQWGPEATALALRVLDSDAPVLIVATLRTDLEPRDPSSVEALVRASQVLDIAPLEPGETAGLVQALVALSSSMVDELVRRTRGHPLFVQQLLGDWVDRSVLVSTEAGICLREGADVSLPDALFDLWVERLRDLAPADREALELAAALGDVVHEEVWRAAAERAGVGVSEVLVDDLERRRLVVRTDHGFAFVHGMLTEGLERLAREGDRWPSWADAAGHAALDVGVEHVHGRGHALEAAPWLLRAELLLRGERGAGWMRACQWLAASDFLRGRHDEAVSWCERGLERARGVGDAHAEAELLGELGRAVTQTDPVRAVAHLEAATARAEALGDDPMRGRLLARLSTALVRLQRFDDAHAAATTALELDRATGNRRSEATALSRLGRIHQRRDELDLATEAYTAALGIEEEVGNLFLQGVFLQNLGLISVQRGHLPEARELLERALAVQREGGARRSEGIVLASLGGLNHELGAAEAAQEAYRAAIQILAEVGEEGQELMVWRNLSLLQRESGDLETPLGTLQRIERRGRAQGDGWRTGAACLELAALHLDRGELDAAEAAAERGWEALGPAAAAHESSLLLGTQAEVAARRGDFSRADALLARGQALTRDVGQPALLAGVLCARARVDLLRGDRDAALGDVAAVRALWPDRDPPARVALHLQRLECLLKLP